jgi:hypothetical protein
VVICLTVPSTVGTSTTSIQGSDVGSTTGVNPVTSAHEPPQDEILVLTHSSKPVERQQFPVTPIMQTNLVNPAKPTLQYEHSRPKLELGGSTCPDIRLMFNDWETDSVKAMVLSNLSSPMDIEFTDPFNQLPEISPSDASSELADSTSDYLPLRTLYKVNAWLEDVFEQPQTTVGCDNTQ